jgi:hypothetical protein
MTRLCLAPDIVRPSRPKQIVWVQVYKAGRSSSTISLKVGCCTVIPLSNFPQMLAFRTCFKSVGFRNVKISKTTELNCPAASLYSTCCRSMIIFCEYPNSTECSVKERSPRSSRFMCIDSPHRALRLTREGAHNCKFKLRRSWHGMELWFALPRHV